MWDVGALDLIPAQRAGVRMGRSQQGFELGGGVQAADTAQDFPVTELLLTCINTLNELVLPDCS